MRLKGAHERGHISFGQYEINRSCTKRKGRRKRGERETEKEREREKERQREREKEINERELKRAR